MEKIEIAIEIPLDAMTELVTAEISIVQGKEPIVAFVQLDFGFLTIKGITVKKRDFKNDGNEVLIFDLPAYRAGVNYVKSVFISDKRIFTGISQAVLKRVEEELGGSNGFENHSDQYVNPNDIPF